MPGKSELGACLQTIAYGIQDVLSKAFFGWVLMLSLGKLFLAGRYHKVLSNTTFSRHCLMVKLQEAALQTDRNF